MWTVLQIKYMHTLLITSELEKFYIWHKILSTTELRRKEPRVLHHVQFSQNFVHYFLYSKITSYNSAVRKLHHIFSN
jgi:hypothetical protein